LDGIEEEEDLEEEEEEDELEALEDWRASEGFEEEGFWKIEPRQKKEEMK
jgi:hypothetical protein